MHESLTFVRVAVDAFTRYTLPEYELSELVLIRCTFTQIFSVHHIHAANKLVNFFTMVIWDVDLLSEHGCHSRMLTMY